MAYSYSRRQEIAREKGYASYYEYRKAQSQNKGFANPYEEARIKREYRAQFGTNFPKNPPRSALMDNPIWTGQVPEGLQDDPELQNWFRRGFMTPLLSHRHLNEGQRTARRRFIEAIPDFDWDVWGDYADDMGGGETDIYAGT